MPPGWLSLLNPALRNTQAGGGDKQNPNKPQPNDGNTRVQRGREALAVGFPVLSMGRSHITPMPLPFMTQQEETVTPSHSAS